MRQILSLCSGYGGLDLAVEAITEARTAFVADSAPGPAAILAARFPRAVNLGDISAVDWAAFAAARPEIDIIAAGFPCQGLSNAGLRKGFADERSAVWKHVARAVGVIRPRIVFLENVAAIRSRGLNVVAEDLAGVGYGLRWTCLRASDPRVGAAHQRYRWFGIAVPADAPGVGRAARRPESEEQQGAVRRLAGDGGEPAADTDGPGLEVRGVQSARAELAPAERDDLAPEDADGEPRGERLGAAPGQASRGGAWPNP